MHLKTPSLYFRNLSILFIFVIQVLGYFNGFFSSLLIPQSDNIKIGHWTAQSEHVAFHSVVFDFVVFDSVIAHEICRFTNVSFGDQTPRITQLG